MPVSYCKCRYKDRRGVLLLLCIARGEGENTVQQGSFFPLSGGGGCEKKQRKRREAGRGVHFCNRLPGEKPSLFRASCKFKSIISKTFIHNGSSWEGVKVVKFVQKVPSWHFSPPLFCSWPWPEEKGKKGMVRHRKGASVPPSAVGGGDAAGWVYSTAQKRKRERKKGVKPTEPYSANKQQRGFSAHDEKGGRKVPSVLWGSASFSLVWCSRKISFRGWKIANFKTVFMPF